MTDCEWSRKINKIIAECTKDDKSIAKREKNKMTGANTEAVNAVPALIKEGERRIMDKSEIEVYEKIKKEIVEELVDKKVHCWGLSKEELRTMRVSIVREKCLIGAIVLEEC